MNYISGLILLTGLFACAACGSPASETGASDGSQNYTVHYTITPNRGDGSVAVQMAVDQTRGQLRELSFALANLEETDIKADGELQIDDGIVRWRPNRNGGSLFWRSHVPHRRGNGGYDALLNKDWGIFRAEDVIPRARTRTLKGASSKTSMTFELPEQWTAISEYSAPNSRIEVANPDRRFDQPRGWIAMGELGVRREMIAGTRVSVAAPEGQSVRRMDMLALLNWTLPEMYTVLPDAIPRLTIVSAGDPMWRGGLSAPASVYIHADRPLISENATSTLVHEIVHVAMDVTAEEGFDWIVEGLAEYYSLELLQRGGAITARRYRRAIEKQSEWANDATKLCSPESTGAATALAVIVFRQLADELRKETAGKVSLDDVLSRISENRSKISLQTLGGIVTELLQRPAVTLSIENLPGCQTYLMSSET